MIIENGILKKVEPEDLIDGKTLIIPEGVTEIHNYIYYHCRDGEEAWLAGDIDYPEDVYTEIECSALDKVKPIVEEVILPLSFTRINEKAFKGCYKLKKITIPNTVTEIGEEAFCVCESLESVNIPQNVKFIGFDAFRYCKSLKTVTIPKSVTEIDLKSFNLCKNLISINIPDTLKSKLSKSIGNNGLSFLDELYLRTESINLIFGEYADRIRLIKRKGGFRTEFDEFWMNVFYKRMIGSIGIDETARMIEMPDIPQHKVEEYINEKNKRFRSLYNIKYNISGDLGDVISLMKVLNLSQLGKDEQNNIMNNFNTLLKANPNIGINELLKKSFENSGIEYRFQDKKGKNLIDSLNKSLINRNLENIRDKLTEGLKKGRENGFSLVRAQVEPVRKMVEDVARNEFIQQGKIDMDTFFDKIQRKMESANAPYIIRNSINITNIVKKIFEDSKIESQLNYTLVNSLNNVTLSIKGGWRFKLEQALKKAGYNFNSVSDNFDITEDKLEILKNEFEIIGIDIKSLEVEPKAVPKDRVSIFDRCSFLEREGLIITAQQIHDMFGSVHEPYSEKFKKFYAEHKKEFLSNPDFYLKFGIIHNNFDNIINSPELKNVYEEGELTIIQIIDYLNTIQYENQRYGDEELALYSKTIGGIADEEEFEWVQKIFDIVKKRERTSIPPTEIETENFRGRMLSPDDVLNLFAGNLTSCCQRFHDIGEGSMLIGAIEENGGIFVIEDLREGENKGKIIAQSLTIRQKGNSGNNDRLTFDNVEIGKDLTESEHAEILEIYKQAAEQAIKKDKKFLGSLLKKGLITEEQYERTVLKEVVAGVGCNDLNELKDLPKATVVVPDVAMKEYKTIEGYADFPWIDSTNGEAPNSEKGIPVVLARISIEERKRLTSVKEQPNLPGIESETEADKSIGEPDNKINEEEIPLWYGKAEKVKTKSKNQITAEDIEIIKNIENIVFRENHRILNNGEVRSTDDICYEYNLSDNMKIKVGSNNDWYMIYDEGEEHIDIADLAMIGGINSDKSGNEEAKKTSNIMLATAEMAESLYQLLIDATESNKTIKCKATRDTSLVNVTRMLRKGLIELTDEDGEKIVYDRKNKQLKYENNDDILYSDFYGSDDIEMLDLIITPNKDKIYDEYNKTVKFLKRAQEAKRMKGKEKEEGIDELRSEIR